jgi:hypothetical protein
MIVCATWDLGNCAVADDGAEGGDIHLLEEVAATRPFASVAEPSS